MKKKEYDFANMEVPPPPRTVRNPIWDRDGKEQLGPDVYAAEQAARQAVFAKIAPKDNWKMPINAVIAEADVLECNEAAVWFTGGPIEIVRRFKNGKVRVQGAGYYVHIGA